MAKSKNHTAHNQSSKAHRNGIYKPKYHKYTKTKGMDPKFLRNQKWALKHNRSPKAMRMFTRKKRVSKLLEAYYAKNKDKLARRIKLMKAAKGQPKKEGAKRTGAYGLTKDQIYRITLTPKQRFAKKFRFISRDYVRKQKIFRGRTELVKANVKALYQKDVAARHKRALRHKKTAVPADSYVKFNPKAVLGVKKKINKTFKQIQAEEEKRMKASKKASKANAKGKSDKKAASSDKKAEKKPEKGKEKSKGDKSKGEKPKGDKSKGEKPKGEKPKGDKPKVEKPKGDKPAGDKPKVEKPKVEKPKAEKKQEKPKEEEKPAL